MIGPLPHQIREGGRVFHFSPFQTPPVANETDHNGDKMLTFKQHFPIRSPNLAAPIGPRLLRLFGSCPTIHHRYPPGAV